MISLTAQLKTMTQSIFSLFTPSCFNLHALPHTHFSHKKSITTSGWKKILENFSRNRPSFALVDISKDGMKKGGSLIQSNSDIIKMGHINKILITI